MTAATDTSRSRALAALMDCYQAAGVMLKNLGIRGLPALAAIHSQHVAEAMDDPAWLGLAAWLRAYTLGGPARPRMLEVSLQAANALEPHLEDSNAQQMYGALHLNAALASAAMCCSDATTDHLNEAGVIADRLDSGGRGFGSLYFGPDNVGIWRVAMAIELGEPGRAPELARQVYPHEPVRSGNGR